MNPHQPSCYICNQESSLMVFGSLIICVRWSIPSSVKAPGRYSRTKGYKVSSTVCPWQDQQSEVLDQFLTLSSPSKLDMMFSSGRHEISWTDGLNLLVAMVQRGCMDGLHGTETKWLSEIEVKTLRMIYQYKSKRVSRDGEIVALFKAHKMLIIN